MPSTETVQAADAAAEFIAHHGRAVFDLVVAQLDTYLTEHPLSTLEDLLAFGPIFDALLGRSRRQFRHALQGIDEHEPVWMIFTYDPAPGKRRASFDVRTVVGPCGPITVSFEEKFKGNPGSTR